MSAVNTCKFSFVWGGIPARGFGDGDAVSVEWDEATTKAYCGTRGEGTLINGKCSSGKITVLLQNNSATVKAYSRLYDTVNAGFDEAPSFIYKKRDGQETITITGTCNLEKHVNETSSKDMPEAELVFISADMVKERS